MENVFQALADPTRRKILQMLNDGDKSAGEIAAAFNMTAPSISHHLNVLKKAELVTTHRNKQSIIYALNTTVVQEFLQVLLGIFQVGEGESKKEGYDVE
ncbi:MAG: winged helix-turn-helix transcriptional regulator [Anaerolineae bacterium]|nr:winged helix-turn-helix transcriptional regulator [Anaerolineae bacterium]MCA9892169.1 winged helix-turn-helix transcriptional regulator [Anaerolineae bacterium]